MSIEPGRSLLHYRLVEKLGEGGMGVVWKALDTSLGREVAIKILPEAFAADAERLARFEREARLLASLNHPGIAAVYGLHESPSSGTEPAVRFLAMELVEGQDLGTRLLRGKLALEDALELTCQVCAAFEAAHEAGVIHRDLKPANVMLTAEGKVKVLDFGLAKALTGDPTSGSGVSASLSPTVTSAGTQAGVILGTAAYMSPEQARGKPVDRRTDIWAIGCLLFEMLTGRVMFRGETVTDTLAAVVRAEPEWETLPPDTPPSVRRLLRRTLEKDPARRIRDAGDLRLEIEETLAGDAELAVSAEPPPVRPGRARWSGVAWALAGAALALVAAWIWSSPPAHDGTMTARFEVVGATGEALIEPWSVAVSPDGRRLAWVVIDGAHRSIHLREIDALETQRLPDTDGAAQRPAFSPDGQSIAFYAQGKLRRLDLGDRAAIDLCDAVAGAGISWGEDDTIVFNGGWISPLSRVSAAGGTPETATRLDEQDGEIGHWFPRLLPDGRHVLISRWRTGLDDMTVAVASLDGGEIRDLIPRASFASYVPAGSGGRILFARAGAIYAVPFDAERLEVSGRPVMLLDGVEQSWSAGNSTWAVSQNGVLAYLPGSLWATKQSIVRVSRDGTATPIDVDTGAYLSAAISPDATRLALTKFENGKTNVLIRDLARGVDAWLPEGAVNTWPVWSPDGDEIVFATARAGPWDIHRYRIDGAAQPEPIVHDVPDQIPLVWSPDGRFLVWQEDYVEVRMMDLRGDRAPRVVLPGVRSNGVSISPDSRWIAFSAWVSGKRQILVRRFPDGTRDYQVSIDGGDYPLWTRGGRELLYRRGDAVLSAPLRVAGDEIVAERPRVLFRGEYAQRDDAHEWSYDAINDELIMIRRGENETSRDRIVVVIDWPAELNPS